jgi:hypothetical protein
MGRSAIGARLVSLLMGDGGAHRTNWGDAPGLIGFVLELTTHARNV